MKVGIIGAGRQGRRRAEAIMSIGEGEVAAVADIRLELAEALARDCNAHPIALWQEVIEQDDLDIVIVSTPPNSHFEIALAAINAGKHTLVEKPLTPDLESAQQLVKAAERNGVRLKCGFNLRFHPGIAEAQRLVKEGAIGEPFFLRCRYGAGGHEGYDKTWHGDPQIAGGGEALDTGIHVVDLFRWFSGDFSEVLGVTVAKFWDFHGMEDNIFAILRGNRDEIAIMHTSSTQWRNLFSLEVFGREGYVTIEGLGYVYGVETLHIGKRDPHPGPIAEQVIEYVGPDRSWMNEWREFVNAIRENHEPLGNGNDGLEGLRLIHAAYDSARNGRFVRVR